MVEHYRELSIEIGNKIFWTTGPIPLTKTIRELVFPLKIITVVTLPEFVKMLHYLVRSLLLKVMPNVVHNTDTEMLDNNWSPHNRSIDYEVKRQANLPKTVSLFKNVLNPRLSVSLNRRYLLTRTT